MKNSIKFSARIANIPSFSPMVEWQPQIYTFESRNLNEPPPPPPRLLIGYSGSLLWQNREARGLRSFLPPLLLFLRLSHCHPFPFPLFHGLRFARFANGRLEKWLEIHNPKISTAHFREPEGHHGSKASSEYFRGFKENTDKVS